MFCFALVLSHTVAVSMNSKPDSTVLKGFALLDAFFTDHREHLLCKCIDEPSYLLGYLLEHLTFDQLLQAANEEVLLQKQLNGRSASDDQCQVNEEPDDIDSATQPEQPFLEWDESISIEYSPSKGRHMKISESIANSSSSSIPTGTYLIREAVLSIAYKADHGQRRCALCACKVPQSCAHPCPGCTKAVFCSSRCWLNEAISKVHSAECCLTPLLSDFPLALHAYRLVGGLGLESVVRFYREKAEEEDDPMQHLQQRPLLPNSARFELLDAASQLRAFAIVDSFVEHPAEEPQRQLELLCWALKVLLLVNQRQHYFANCNQSELHQSDFALLVARVASLLRKLSFNVFCWSECVEFVADDEVEKDPEEAEHVDRLNCSRPVANCLCLGVSFANHSCDAATFWEIDDGLFILSSACTLSPGDELTLTYGPHQFMDFHKRQRRLLTDYHFTCGCSACLEDVSRLLCLGCTSDCCSGPIYPAELIGDQVTTCKQAKCMRCGAQPVFTKATGSYEEVMREVITMEGRLFAHCRRLEVGFDAKIVLTLVSKLTGSLYLPSLALIRIYTVAWHALLASGASFEQEIDQLASLYLDALEVASVVSGGTVKCWPKESALQRNLLLSKWLRIFRKKCKHNSEHTNLMERIESILSGTKLKSEGSIVAKDELLDFQSKIIKRLDASSERRQRY